MPIEIFSILKGMIQVPVPDSESIRLEFECFLRIGQDRHMREDLVRNLERLILLGLPISAFLPRIYFEVRTSDGGIQEMWDLQVHEALARRLLAFLKRFSPEQVRLMDQMMRA